MKSENNRVIKLEFEIENSWNWIAQDKDGSITIFENEPNLVDDMWDSDGPYKVLCLENTNVILESEWKNSLKLIDNF